MSGVREDIGKVYTNRLYRRILNISMCINLLCATQLYLQKRLDITDTCWYLNCGHQVPNAKLVIPANMCIFLSVFSLLGIHDILKHLTECTCFRQHTCLTCFRKRKGYVRSQEDYVEKKLHNQITSLHFCYANEK